MKPVARWFDPVFLARPTLMYPIWIFFLAGYWSGSRWRAVPSVTRTDAVLIGIGLTAVMGAAYILNQIRDIETDRINRKLFLLCDGHLGVRFAYQEAALLAFSGLFLGFTADLRAGTLLTVLFLLAGWFYNYPPARWKDRPIAGLLVNGSGGLLISAAGWIAAGGAGWIPLRSLAYFGGFAAVTFNTMLPDIEGDRAAGKSTFAVRYGLRTTVVWALVAITATTVLSFLFTEWILFYPGLAMIPFFAFALTRKEVGDVIRATKYSVLAMAVAVCVVFPWFLVPVFLVFFGSKWYYKQRFGMDYPNLKAK